MKCPYCEAIETKVIDSRNSSRNSVRRRRHCISCGKRFTTYEKVMDFSVVVVKRDGVKEMFDEGKILKGILLATEKRNLSQEIAENIVANIQREVEENDMAEIPSSQLGTMVMNKLIDVDKVAYLRFASVYKNFDKIEHFIEEIESFEK